jgi:phage replication O-like protein O
MSIVSTTYDKRIQAPNYTQIPNVIFDYWMNHLSHAEFKVLCAICRKTFGWHKTEDHISTKQLMNLTGVSRRCIQDCINVLIDHGLIEVLHFKTSDGDDAPNLFRISVYENDQEGSAISAPPLAKIDRGVVQPLHPGSAAIAPTKETNQKKDIKREAFGQFVKLTSEQYVDLCKIHGKEKVNEIIQSINDHCINNRPKGYLDYAAAFRIFLKNYKPGAKQNSQGGNDKENYEWSKWAINEYHSPTHTLTLLGKYLEFTPKGMGQPICLEYSANGFKEQFDNNLRKCGFRKRKFI